MTATAFATGLVDGRSACAASWVASPNRALGIAQRIPALAGRDFWLLLEPKWHELAGVKDIWSHSSGNTRTVFNAAFATLNALKETRSLKQIIKKEVKE